MNAHRVYIFNGTHDNSVIGGVANDLHFVFFPPHQRFINQYLGRGRSIQPLRTDFFVFFGGVGYPPACATHSKGGANHGGQADILHRGEGLGQGFGNRGAGRFYAQSVHSGAEKLAVFCHFNGVAVCAYHGYIVAFERAVLIQIKGGV